MCPDNETPTGDIKPTENPTLAQDDKYRRTVVPAEGPNKDGYDDLVKSAHPERDETFTPATTVETEPAIESAIKKDVEPSMPAPDAPQEG